MILLVDLEVARIPVGVPVRRRLELPRGAVFQPIVPARVELLPIVNEVVSLVNGIWFSRHGLTRS